MSNGWVPEFEGQRPPLDGNKVGLETRFQPTHGAYSKLELSPRTVELAAEVRGQLEREGLYSQSFELAIARLALVWARIERAAAAIDSVDEAPSQPLSQYRPEMSDQLGLQRLRDDLKGWLRLADRIEESLGLTPGARVKLGLELAQTHVAQTRREALADRYRRDDGGEAAA